MCFFNFDYTGGAEEASTEINLQYPTFGEMSLSMDHRLRTFCKLASQWRTAPILTHPTEVFKSLQFPPLNSVPWACADNFEHAYAFLTTITKGVVNSVYKVVIQSSFGVTI